MANKYSAHSLRQRKHLHPVLQLILDKVLETDDFRIDEGSRSRSKQKRLYATGFSKTLDSEHLIKEDGFAYAADVCPYINGKRLATDKLNFKGSQKAQFAWFLRGVKETAELILLRVNRGKTPQFELRFGVDWDQDGEILTDQSFQDWFHIELRTKPSFPKEI